MDTAGVLDAAEELASRPSGTVAVTVPGLSVEMSSADPALVGWVPVYLDPLTAVSREPEANRVVVHCAFSDALVTRVWEEITRADRLSTTPGYQRLPLHFAPAKDGMTMFMEPQSGVAWIVDATRSVIWLIVSTRTCWPALELSRLVREVISLHLERIGWFQCHAACVVLDDASVLIAGGRRAGKTSLVLALMEHGAAYVANDRVFLRHTPDGFEVMSYPMAVAVGLGSALQFELLEPYITAPDALVFPRRRLDVQNIRHTPRNQWAHLADKIDFLPRELEMVFGAPPRQRGGQVRVVVVPNVQHGARSPQLVSKGCGESVVREHAKRDPDYPCWLELGWGSVPRERESFRKQSLVGAFELTYSISRDCSAARGDIAESIRDVIR